MSQNRQSRRSPVLLAASIDVDGAPVGVRLRNLSASGALIEGTRLPPEGSVTTFNRNELSVQGRIVWIAGRFAGVAFEQPLNPDDLLRNIPKPRERIETQFRRPGLTRHTLSEEERRMVELWLAPPVLKT